MADLKINYKPLLNYYESRLEVEELINNSNYNNKEKILGHANSIFYLVENKDIASYSEASIFIGLGIKNIQSLNLLINKDDLILIYLKNIFVNHALKLVSIEVNSMCESDSFPYKSTGIVMVSHRNIVRLQEIVDAECITDLSLEPLTQTINQLNSFVENHKGYATKEMTDYRNSTQKKNGCYVATEIYGSCYAPEVILLQSFKKQFLKKYFLGNIFVNCYYFVSPYLVLMSSKNKLFTIIFKHIINCILILIKRYIKIK